mmetsp:Transcript_39777/g.80173  ORF Transcript_39777/g.80173 Transcript_39777/m.80173 type:complete len:98 (+) Transcript_39777:105-398(+)
MSSNSEMGCSPSQFDAASVPTSKAAQAEAQDRDTEDAASHVETAVAGMDAPGEAGDEFDFFEDRDKFPPRFCSISWPACVVCLRVTLTVQCEQRKPL